MPRFAYRWIALTGVAALTLALAAFATPQRARAQVAPTATPTPAATPAAPTAPKPFTVGLWGDVPYQKQGNSTQVPLLINDMNASNLAFTIFDGDTKDGSSACTDDVIGKQALDRFNSVAAPTVYVIGDNEWTDCHRTNNNSYNPFERLDYIRKMFFTQKASLGKTTMPIEHQGGPAQLYAENTRWTFQNVMFVTINMPGSNNNFIISKEDCADSRTKRTPADCYADNTEAIARDGANIAWVRQAFATAKAQNMPGIMIVAQADPSFDLPETVADERSDPAFSGFTNFLNVLAEETQNYKGQVVYVHGDTHFYKVDKPLAIGTSAKGNQFIFTDPSRVIPNFTRVQTFGNSNVDWIKCTVDVTNPNVFLFEPRMIPIVPPAK